eukprot:GHVU01067839.1.p2 GENE.GHVU01067839.1~~GHVU01067839.1.p2  ORF type:complete len:101 (+),score=6.96 GHVU01067839.1:277-579(+)
MWQARKPCPPLQTNDRPTDPAAMKTKLLSFLVKTSPPARAFPSRVPTKQAGLRKEGIRSVNINRGGQNPRLTPRVSCPCPTAAKNRKSPSISATEHERGE